MDETPEVHAVADEAPPTAAPWANIFSWDALRYQQSGWWIDAILPRTPFGVVLIAFAVPVLWFGVGMAVTHDRSAYLDTHDVTLQIPFFALHVLSLRVMASLWARGLGPSLDGLAIDPEAQRSIRAGALTRWVNLGALLCAAYFIYRDTYMGLWPKLAPTHQDDGSWTAGMNAFDDPDMWDFGALGRPVHGMMLGLWHAEWLIYGYLLWVQLWAMYSIGRAFLRADWSPHLSRILIENRYRDFFGLVGRAATVSLVFALGNLAFIYETGELFPRDVVEIAGVSDFLIQMSDLLSTSILFVVVLGSGFLYFRLLRMGLTRAVDKLFAESSDLALQNLAAPLTLTGDPTDDVARLAERVEAQSGIIRAIAFQTEIRALGARTLMLTIAKATGPLGTTVFRITKMKLGHGAGGEH